MEKYIGVKPSDKRPAPLRENDGAPPSWDVQKSNKESFMFQSVTERKRTDRDGPGPQDYLV